MLNCKQASALMSRAMDEKLPFGKILALKLHLFICDGCTNFSSQIFLLRQAARLFGKRQPSHDPHLSEEAKQRISHALRDALAQKDKEGNE